MRENFSRDEIAAAAERADGDLFSLQLPDRADLDLGFWGLAQQTLQSSQGREVNSSLSQIRRVNIASA